MIQILVILINACLSFIFLLYARKRTKDLLQIPRSLSGIQEDFLYYHVNDRQFWKTLINACLSFIILLCKKKNQIFIANSKEFVWSTGTFSLTLLSCKWDCFEKPKSTRVCRSLFYYMQEKESKIYCKFHGVCLEYKNIFFNLIIMKMRLFWKIFTAREQ